MDFLINSNELEALYGLSHIQQLVYLRGIRPFMDIKTGLAGIKRGISHQSIAEELYIETIPGCKGAMNSRMQIRRAIAALERAGVVKIESQGFQLILKCNLATRDFYAKKKADIRPTQQDDISKNQEGLGTTRFKRAMTQETDRGESPQADTPHIKDNYLYIFLQQKFEQFWSLYPEKKSRSQAWEIFQELNPDDALFGKIMNALVKQIQYHQENQVEGVWVPPWKYPANWLSKRAWEDELTMKQKQESQHAASRQNTRNESGRDPFWNPELECETPRTNIIEFKKR